MGNLPALLYRHDPPAPWWNRMLHPGFVIFYTGLNAAVTPDAIIKLMVIGMIKSTLATQATEEFWVLDT
ncbi:hypothetical protein FRB95_014283 [Tulasnella sp. JGI-2019a]|nr:hypothetical protein FRB95_014283 [Tulasnella sp. JGI-2019a]